MRHWVRASCHDCKWIVFRKWFAWRPVLVGEFLVWLETIERRDWHGEGITYRDYRFIGKEDEHED